MSLVKYHDFKSKLKTMKKSDVSPVYFFYGKDGYLIDEAVSCIEKMIIDASEKDLNYNVFHLTDKKTSDLIMEHALQSANAYPFISEKKLVVIKNIHKLPASQDSFLEDYAANPSRTSCLILVALVADGKLPKRKIFGEIEKMFPSVNFYHLYEGGISHWVTGRFKGFKKNIDSDAAQTLFEITGDNLADIKNEVDKLVLYAGENTEITSGDVEKCCGHFKENTVFELMPALARKEADNAIKILENLFNTGENEYAILSSITGRYRQYLKFHEIAETGVADSDAALRVGIRAYVEKFLSDVRLLSKEDVGFALQKILDTELEMKTGANSRMQIEKLFFELCNPPGQV